MGLLGPVGSQRWWFCFSGSSPNQPSDISHAQLLGTLVFPNGPALVVICGSRFRMLTFMQNHLEYVFFKTFFTMSKWEVACRKSEEIAFTVTFLESPIQSNSFRIVFMRLRQPSPTWFWHQLCPEIQRRYREELLYILWFSLGVTCSFWDGPFNLFYLCGFQTCYK